MKLLKLSLVLFMAISITLTSCKKEEKKNTHDDAYGDAFIKKVKLPLPSGAVVKYGIVFYAGGEGLKTCTVKAPDGTVSTLLEYWKGEGNLRTHPPISELKTTMPTAGTYTFTLVFDDGEKVITDEVSSVEIDPMEPTTISYEESTHTVTASWTAISNVDEYMIKLTDENKNNDKPIFVDRMSSASTTYTLDKSTSGNPGWMQTGEPQTGDTNFVFVVGVKYETGASGATKEQNKQILTAFGKMITW